MSGKRVPVLICDACGDHLLDVHPRTTTLRAARAEAHERGWTNARTNRATFDYCASCCPA